MAETYSEDGSVKRTKGNKKPKNFILEAIEKRLLRKDNVAPAANLYSVSKDSKTHSIN